MRQDSRLSRMLHVLLHMARIEGLVTSDEIAKMLQTNPVVVRRTMSGLREAGYVASQKGHGGGWTLAKDLHDLSLLDILKAVGGVQIFAIGNERENPDCMVEQVVNSAIDETLEDAQNLLFERFAGISLGELAEEFDRRFGDCKQSTGH